MLSFFLEHCKYVHCVNYCTKKIIVWLYGISYIFHDLKKGVSLNPSHGEVYSIQHYVIKCICDLRQVGGFLRVLRFHPPIKLTVTI
jgi:hypothetical protein